MKTRPETKLVTEDPDHAANNQNKTADKKNQKRPDSKLVTEDPDQESDQAAKKNQMPNNGSKHDAAATNVAGGSPSAGAVKGDGKHRDDSKKGSEKLKNEAVRKSEQQNLTQKKGYNEIPRNIPVKSARQKA